jgi:hypothetical protein
LWKLQLVLENYQGKELFRRVGGRNVVRDGRCSGLYLTLDTAAGPCHSSDVEEDMGYHEVSSLEEARAWLEG